LSFPHKRKNFYWHHDDCGALQDKAYGIVSLPDDGLIVVGNSRSQQSLEYNAWILRLDRDGKIIWERSFGGSRSDQLYAVASTSDGGIVVAGHTRSKGAGKSDVWILRLNIGGELLWERTFGGQLWDRPTAAALTMDGGLAVAGYTTSTAPDTKIYGCFEWMPEAGFNCMLSVLWPVLGELILDRIPKSIFDHIPNVTNFLKFFILCAFHGSRIWKGPIPSFGNTRKNRAFGFGGTVANGYDMIV
jgi:hypothetical protein